MSDENDEECFRRRKMLPRNGRGDGPGGRLLKERAWRMSMKIVRMEMMVMMRIGRDVVSILNIHKGWQKQKTIQPMHK